MSDYLYVDLGNVCRQRPGRLFGDTDRFRVTETALFHAFEHEELQTGLPTDQAAFPFAAPRDEAGASAQEQPPAA